MRKITITILCLFALVALAENLVYPPPNADGYYPPPNADGYYALTVEEAPEGPYYPQTNDMEIWLTFDKYETNTTQILDQSSGGHNMTTKPTFPTGPTFIPYTNSGGVNWVADFDNNDDWYEGSYAAQTWAKRPVSWSCWINVDDDEIGSEREWNHMDGNGNGWRGTGVAQFHLRVYYYDPTYRVFSVTNIYTLDTWHLVTLVTSNSGTTVYIDDDRIYKTSWTWQNAGVNGSTFKVGSGHPVRSPWDGMLDDFIIWTNIISYADHLLMHQRNNPVTRYGEDEQ